MRAGRSNWPKNQIVVLDPAAKARLPPSIIPTKIFSVVNNLVFQLGLHLLWICLALQWTSSVFVTFSFQILDFYGCDRWRDKKIGAISVTRFGEISPSWHDFFSKNHHQESILWNNIGWSFISRSIFNELSKKKLKNNCGWNFRPKISAGIS
jgi:hypothetical protein